MCDFHQLQKWNRWVTKHKELTEEKDELLKKMKAIAVSGTIDDYNISVQTLMSSKTWAASPEFRRWFLNTWLNNSKVCVFSMNKFHLTCVILA